MPNTPTSTPTPDADALLARLRDQADTLFDKTLTRYRDEMTCRAGCFGCCQGGLTVSPLEARDLAAALRALPAPLSARLRDHLTAYAAATDADTLAYCALLIDGQCAAYAARPLICRTHGMPIRFTDDEGAAFLDICPLNFTDDPDLSSVTPDHILDLDHLNHTLALINHLALPDAPREPLLDIALAALHIAPPTAPITSQSA
jgi:uncharacterized protein